MRVLNLMGVSVRRVMRDRLSLFFIVVMPIVVILIIGASARGFSSLRVGVVDSGSGAAGRQLTAMLSSTPGIEVRTYPTTAALQTAVRRSTVQAGLVLPAGMDQAIEGADVVKVGLVAERTNPTQQAAAAAVRSVLDRYAGQVQAARFATGQVGGDFGSALARAGPLQAVVPSVEVVSREVVTRRTTLPEGFSYSAPTMLVLFVFLNAILGSTSIITNRRLGLYERMLAGPVRSGVVVAGEALGLVVVALVQAVLIVAVGALAFGVSWGDPLGAAALVGVWALVGAGAGMLAGTLFSTPEQATAIGSALGIALAMLGGCMWPLSIVGPAMRFVGHFTPQAWAVDAWTRLVSQHGTIGSIASQILVLAAFAAVFLSLAAWRLRRRLA